MCASSCPTKLVDLEKREIETDDGPLPLSRAEVRLLRVLARQLGEVVSWEVLSTELDAKRRGLDTIVRGLRKKVANTVLTVPGRGLMLAAEVEDSQRERMVSIGGATLDRQQGMLFFEDGRNVGLTELEQEVVELLAAKPGVALERATIQKTVWGSQGDTRAVDNVVFRIRKKVGSDFVQSVVGGYQLGSRPARGPTLGGLPGYRTPLLVGRDRDLTLVADLISEHRLVTLHGPMGIGKTQLALGLASRREGPNVWATGGNGFRALLAQLASAVCLDVDVNLGVQLIQVLNRVDPLLIVLDEVDPQSDEMRRWVMELLNATDATLLCTSTDPLNIEGEATYQVEPLGTQDATRLFRRLAHTRGFPVSGSPTLVTLVEGVGNNPLAIELLVGRLKHQTLDQLERDLTPEGLEGTIERSLGFLGSDEQQMLLDLSVHHRVFSREEALMVGNEEALSTLVAGGFLQVHQSQLKMLTPIRLAARRLAHIGYQLVRRESDLASGMESPPILLPDGRIDLDQASVERSDGHARLTTDEVALLRILTRHHRAMVHRDRILRLLWGPGAKASNLAALEQALRAKVEARPASPVVLKGNKKGLGLFANIGGLIKGKGTQTHHFVGRDDEMAALSSQVQRHRLLTVLGPGGIGKTQLAWAVVDRVAEAFSGGISCIGIEGVTRVDAFLQALVVGLGLGRTPNPEEDVIRALKNRAKTLIVLDNLEDCAALIGPVVERLLHETSAVIMATSRVRLGIVEEAVFSLGGIGEHHASDLLLRCAERTGAPPPDQGTLQSVLTATAGIPLAIEHAAAQLRVMGWSDLVSRLDQTLDLQSPGHPQRHANLRTVLDSSWALLSIPEKSGLAALSVFCRGFTMEAAEAVGAADVLSGLADASWVLRQGPRNLILEPLRQYVTDRVTKEQGRLHSRFYADLMSATLHQQLDDPELLELLTDRQDLEAAYSFALGDGDARTAGLCLLGLAHLGRAFGGAGKLNEQVQAVLPKLEDDDLAVELGIWVSHAIHHEGQKGATIAAELLDQTMERAKTCSAVVRARVEVSYWKNAFRRGQKQAAFEHFQFWPRRASWPMSCGQSST